MYDRNDFRNDFINNLTNDTKALLIKYADDFLDTPYPVILASDFARYSKTGNRTDFEDIYFKRRRMLNAFILAELSANNGRYLDRIIDGIFLLCEESGWQLPPHNSYGNGLGNQPYADVTRPVLDLFSCETGALLALAGVLLKASFDSVSPFICERINHEVSSRILIPYVNTFVWWMGNGTDKTCNWTPWCTQNVLIAAICSDIPEDTFNFILAKAKKSLTYFFNDYGFDGCCDEGALYYRHAGLCLWLSLELLKSQNVDLKFFFEQNDKLRNIAEYILNVHVSGEYYINFADCAPNPGPCSVREFLFGKLTGSTELCNFAAEDFCQNPDYLLTDEINLLYRYMTIMYEKEIRDYQNNDSGRLVSYSNDNSSYAIKNIWYESTGLSIYKSVNMCLAVKAGHNNDSHNHNDTGSVTLYVNNTPCLIDLGVESYTAKTFSQDRYSIWTMQSSYHNLPEINGLGQLAGPDYKAVDVSPDENSISMDISEAYDVHTGLSRLVRTVSIDDAVYMEDNFSFNNSGCEDVEIYENFMVCLKPQWNNGKLRIGDIAVMEPGSYKDCYIEEIPITDPRLSKSYSGSVYRIRFAVSSRTFKIKIVPL